MSLFTELKRRNVIRVAAAYLVASWLLIEATSVLIDIYDAPIWVPKMMVGLLGLGFPITLFFSWAFEITPEGVKREEEVDRSRSVAHETGRRLDLITIALLVFTIGLVGAERYLIAPPEATRAAVDTTAGNSIAVLPFANMSADADNVYFSDGISEEILNVLAKVPELRVAARTSSFQFRGEQQDIPAIASELGVATVLEGSVRKQGERVRITAQLIAADTGFHLWSETYDRDLVDIFAIQDEIAAAIARALQVHLDVESGAADIGTHDLGAYDNYLRGVHFWRMRNEESLLAAIDAFQAAIDADPDFSRAYVGMAGAYTVLADYSSADIVETTWLATRFAAYALALDPSSSQAYAVLGNSVQNRDDFELAIVLYERALLMDPQNSSAMMWLALVHLQRGDVPESIEMLEMAVATDPQYRVAWANLGYMGVVSGDRELAERSIERMRAIDPDYREISNNIMSLGLAFDDRAMVVEGVREAGRVKGGASVAWTEALIEALEGRGDVAAVAAELRATEPSGVFDPARPNPLFPADAVLLLDELGERELALDLLDEIVARPGSDKLWGLYGLHWAAFRCEPRYRAHMRALGYAAKVDSWDCP